MPGGTFVRSAIFIRSSASAIALIAITTLSQSAIAQQKTLEQQLLGTWQYVAVDIVRPDGTRTPLYGPTPQGLAIFDASGNYLLMTARSDLPRFAVSNRTQGSDEENKAIVHGSIAHFGTYTLNGEDKTITFHIHTSTFPNWNGTDQKRPFTLTADELRWRTPASSGGTAEVVLRRVAL